MFPDQPGVEIVAAHQHGAFAQTALRIYSSDGELLYQVWIDGQVLLSYWMPDAEQLVIAGINGMAYWPQRGHPDVKGLSPHPRVVFAVKPRHGYISRDYMAETPGDGPLQPVWYRCLWPPELSDLAGTLVLSRSIGTEPARHIRMTLEIGQDSNRGGITLVLDQHGNELPDSRQLSDSYNVNRSVLPPPEFFQLHDLPPTLEPMRPGAAGTPVLKTPKEAETSSANETP